MSTRHVAHCQHSFVDRLDALLQFAIESRSFYFVSISGTTLHIGARRREMILGMVLLHSHLAWEEFLEKVFVRFMCGAKSASGGLPKLLYPAFSSGSSAMAHLLASYGPNYLKWDQTNTLKYATRYFDKGEPFTTSVGSIGSPIQEIADIRNRFAHRSNFSQSRFRRIVRSYQGFVRRGTTVGRFLASLAPATTYSGTMLEYYVTTMRIAAQTLIS